MTVLPLRFPRLWLAGAVLIVGAIVYGSLTSAQFVAAISRFDKYQHAFAYLVLTLWLTGMLERRRYWVAAVIALVLGAAMEVAQGTLTRVRAADPLDMLANAAGVALAILLAYWALGGWAQAVERWMGAGPPPR